MSGSTILIAILLVVVMVISLWALTSRKNIRQKLKIPWASWNIETSDSNDGTNSVQASGEVAAGVDFGQKNKFMDSIGDVAGGDILKGDSIKVSDQGKGKKSAKVSLGKENEYHGRIGDIAAGDIVKNEKDTNKHK